MSKAYDTVLKARNIDRPNVNDYVQNLFQDFIELKGDRLYMDDSSMLGGIAMFNSYPVTVVGHRKGHSTEDNIKYNFSMTYPSGFRKALRLMKEASNFKRAIVSFIDTKGAYPGVDAEAMGQGSAIATNLYEMSGLECPIISIVTGEGSSGGALGIGLSDRVYMLENAIYSVLSPEGFASILYKDASKAEETADLMKLTAKDLLSAKLIDGIIKEPDEGIEKNPDFVYEQIRKILDRDLRILSRYSPRRLVGERYKKYRKIV